MRKWGMLFTLLFLVGCSNEQTVTDTQLQATIPATIVEQYGLLQLDKKLNHVETLKHPNGSVTFMLNPQETTQLKESVNRLFSQYEKAVSEEENGQITNISYDELYQNVHFYVENEAVIYDENFQLAEELLVKHALAYQLIVGERLGMSIVYYDKAGEHVLSKKTIPIQLSK